MNERLSLTEALGRLADELFQAQRAVHGHGQRFEISSAEVEFQLEAHNQPGGTCFRVAVHPGTGRAQHPDRHRLRLELTVKDEPTGDNATGGQAACADDLGDALDPGAESGPRSQSSARPDRSGAIEPLTISVLRQRMTDTFSAGYLTIIAIIQGVAVGILVTTTAQHELFGHAAAVDRVTVAAQAIATFAAIIIVTHQYLILTALVRWTPTALDTIIPYALGVGEISASLLLGKITLWWGSFAILLLVSISAFAYSLIRGSLPVFGDLHSFHRQFRESLRLQVLLSGGVALFCLVIMFLSICRLASGWFLALAPFGPIAGAIAIEIAGDRDKEDVFVNSGIPWWQFRSMLANQQDDPHRGAKMLRNRSADPVVSCRDIAYVQRRPALAQVMRPDALDTIQLL